MTLEAVLLALWAVEQPPGVTSRIEAQTAHLDASSIEGMAHQVWFEADVLPEGCLLRYPGDDLDTFCAVISLVVIPVTDSECRVLGASVDVEIQWWDWDPPRKVRSRWASAMASLADYYVLQLIRVYAFAEEWVDMARELPHDGCQDLLLTAGQHTPPDPFSPWEPPEWYPPGPTSE